MKLKKYLIKKVRPFGQQPVDILIEGNKIIDLKESSNVNNINIGINDQIIDADGLICLPGFIDLHSHLRDPGLTELENIETGGQSAALGGYTAIHSMPNSIPVADSPEVVNYIHNLGLSSGWVEIRPIGAVTKGLKGKNIAEIGAMHRSSAKVRIFSDDGYCIHNSMVMRRALEYVKTFDGIIAQHSEDIFLTDQAQMNEGALATELGLNGWPAVAEESIIFRDVLLSEYLNSRLHVCHLSTKRGVEIIRWAKKKGIKVTAEVTPHHLLLTEEIINNYNPIYKINPPLRTKEDVLALRQGLVDGTIDVIATDHAPHSQDNKKCEWYNAKPGVIGFETAFAIVKAVMFDTGLMSWQQIADILSCKAAKIAQLTSQGRPLKKNENANLTLIDPNKQWIVDSKMFASKSTNTPFEGMNLSGKVVTTFFRGHPTVLNGNLNPNRS